LELQNNYIKIPVDKVNSSTDISNALEQHIEVVDKAFCTKDSRTSAVIAVTLKNNCEWTTDLQQEIISLTKKTDSAIKRVRIANDLNTFIQWNLTEEELRTVSLDEVKQKYSISSLCIEQDKTTSLNKNAQKSKRKLRKRCKRMCEITFEKMIHNEFEKRYPLSSNSVFIFGPQKKKNFGFRC
jgi:uncharacterized protein YeeX (DUF496 family)